MLVKCVVSEPSLPYNAARFAGAVFSRSLLASLRFAYTRKTVTAPGPLRQHHVALRLIIAQALLVLAVALLVWCLRDGAAALAGLLGGGIGLLGSVVFARHAFRYAGARAAALIVKSFRRGELLKLALTVVFLGAALRVLPGTVAPWLMAGFISSQLAALLVWCVPWPDRPE